MKLATGDEEDVVEGDVVPRLMPGEEPVKARTSKRRRPQTDESDDEPRRRKKPGRPRKEPSDEPVERERRRCMWGECPNQARRGGMCARHDESAGVCEVHGCSERSYYRRHCIKHGGREMRGICMEPGCNNHIVNNRLCVRHGAQTKKCSYSGCPKLPQTGCNGMCKRHFTHSYDTICLRTNCRRIGRSELRGYCRKHCANPQ